MSSVNGRPTASEKVLSRNVPTGASAALFFVKGDLQFTKVEGRTAVSKVVSVAACQEAFGTKGLDSGWLPEGVIRYGTGKRGNWMVGFYPQASREIFIEGKRSRTEKLSLHLPALVFMGVGSQYFVWAIEGKTFKPQADACRAPFPNLLNDGRVCLGSNRHPEVSDKGFAEAWDIFWQSPFTSHQTQQKSKAHKDDVRLQLRAVAASKQAYPVSDLIKMHESVDAIVMRTIAGEEE